jgi:opacity protein-like surface antigen
MSPTRWALPRALSVTLLAALLGTPPAEAQYYEPALRSLDLSPGALARSPRLLGMGGLSLAIPDRDVGLGLWDLGRIPAGLVHDDTTSTLDLRPGTGALSSVRSLPAGRERQNLAARANVAQLEAVYRSRTTGSVFGVVGDLSGLHSDRPTSPTAELRQGVLHPEVLAVLGGRLQRWFGGNVNWATHLRFRSENVQDEYRSIVVNAAGEYIDQAGGLLVPPSEFTPTDVGVRTTAYGFSTAYAIGARTHLALAIEHEGNRIESTNDLQRSSSEIKEDRPFWVGQATLSGRLGRTLEFGVDGIGRTGKSEADWRFSASAGVGSEPLSGRGNLLLREERSSEMRVRLRWTPGRATFAGAMTTAASEVFVDPPNANDATSFNRFLNLAFVRDGTDTLSFPDSVSHRESRRYAVGYGGGASYRFGSTTLGAEFHWSRDIRTSSISYEGPRRIAWDARAGLEHPLGRQMTARAGYAYRSVDEDDFTAGNEYLGHALSVGVGYLPAGARWSLETGYVVELRAHDFESPADERQTRQNLALQVHWAF